MLLSEVIAYKTVPIQIIENVIASVESNISPTDSDCPVSSVNNAKFALNKNQMSSFYGTVTSGETPYIE